MSLFHTPGGASVCLPAPSAGHTSWPQAWKSLPQWLDGDQGRRLRACDEARLRRRAKTVRFFVCRRLLLNNLLCWSRGLVHRKSANSLRPWHLTFWVLTSNKMGDHELSWTIHLPYMVSSKSIWIRDSGTLDKNLIHWFPGHYSNWRYLIFDFNPNPKP